ncbi:Rieske 2Fe-2S domain-containing protein [Paenibacillus alginolyticus]|uniref:Rieske 2Fe-2S domain-containing protein n=1 Tax=Paenibacillus alginolyticus TaxID=59839 RepID=A0ABT4GLE2_9BACL|nr:Rieske 2Fe-2S domain-containing protein [Paenibacillus alginolyticus]MCY9670884.1 Rieske 2Fe-2S domain-containing protein [Paenibacillus alginolyticus]MCY9697002.1 Rieske 2Fe-2S domain-containing protein [Paenibacillus alginolyticus]MEC0145208.1 Rieske 2Fe-2S domain-containing protein [Paenibacillus alginolyticus]
MSASEPDGAPVKVRLLGEDLVAFRDTNGTLGLMDAYCPHRRAHCSSRNNGTTVLRSYQGKARDGRYGHHCGPTDAFGSDPSTSRSVRGCDRFLPKGVDWKEGLVEDMSAKF